MKNLIKLTRLPNSLMAGSGVVIGFICMERLTSISDILWGFVSLSLLAMGGNIQNDLKDIVTDSHSHPDRPLVAGNFSRSRLQMLYLILFTAGWAASRMVSLTHGILALVIILLLWIYNHSLKGRSLVGNLTVSFLCGISIYFAEWPGLINHTLVPFTFAFISTLAREILKDIQDIEGDLRAGLSTLPIKFGVKTAKKISGVLIVLVLFLLPFPTTFFGYHFSFGIAALILVVIPLLKALFQISGKKPQWSKAQKNLKLMMLGGMIAIVLGKVL